MSDKLKVYIIGSLRNPKIPEFANFLQQHGFEAFADWFAPGPAADDYWREYAKARGWSYKQALESEAAKHIFDFDTFHLRKCDAAVMLYPAGKSAHMELGYVMWHLGRPGYILIEEEPERYDVMIQFCKNIYFDRHKLIDSLNFLSARKEISSRFDNLTTEELEKMLDSQIKCIQKEL